MKQRLDITLTSRGLVPTRSQAESEIALGRVRVNGQPARKSGQMVAATDRVALTSEERYVSRAGLKLASVAAELGVDFAGAMVLDVGSSTGGFTDFALQHGARKVIAVDVGTDQLHPSLRADSRVELHEKTDIRGFTPSAPVDIVVIDVSFVSLRQILPHIATIIRPGAQIVAMVKPQFEATRQQITRGGIVKNERVRREILRDFELWAKERFVMAAKRDSSVSGMKGNRERFYLLRLFTK